MSENFEEFSINFDDLHFLDSPQMNLPDSLTLPAEEQPVPPTEEPVPLTSSGNLKRVTRSVDSQQNAEKAEASLDEPNEIWFRHLWVDRTQSNSPNPRPYKKSVSSVSEEESEVVNHGQVPVREFMDPALLSSGNLDTPGEIPDDSKPFIYPYTQNSAPYYTSLVSPSVPQPGSFPFRPPSEPYLPRGPPQYPTQRRKSTSASSKPPTNMPSMPVVRDFTNSMERPELDANYVHLQLTNMGYPQVKKEPFTFIQHAMTFICQYSKIFVGGFYLTNNQPTQKDVSSWIMPCAFPSKEEFTQYFHFNVGERFIMQAALEKRCFCVHSSSWENNNSLLSFLFVPIQNDKNPSSNAIAVMVLGTILRGETDLHAHLLFLDQVRKPISYILNSLLVLQSNLQHLQREASARQETRNSFDNDMRNLNDRTMLAIMQTVKVDLEEYAVITTNKKGLITFASPGALRLLGYQGDDIIGKVSLVQLHDLLELSDRARELEHQYAQSCAADFTVLIKPTLASRGQDHTRVWHWTRKDRSSVLVQVTLRPLHDHEIFGFVAIAKETSDPSSVQHPSPTSPQAQPQSRSPVTQSKSVTSPPNSTLDEVKSE